MGDRHPDKTMQKSWRNFECSLKLCKQANDTGKVARFRNLLDTLQTTYYKFDEDFWLYKEDTIKRICKTEIAFNAMSQEEGEQVPAFPYNDSWADQQMVRFVDVRDLLEDALDMVQANKQTGVSVPEPKVTNVNLLVGDLKAEFSKTEASIIKLKTEIEGHTDNEIPISTAMSYEMIISKLQNKIDQELKEKVSCKVALSEVADDPDYTNEKLIDKYTSFSVKQCGVLDECAMLLVRKTVPRDVETKHLVQTLDSASALPSTSGSNRSREQVFLEKTKPPKFDGDELDFPEFKRKWSAQVSKANLHEETELDKLRDAIPRDANDQLYGVVKLEEAWTILTQRFGDKMLIGKKLKAQLKDVQCAGKNDPEKLISLKIKVRNIVTRLETLGMGAALTHDSEFLSAFYCALPDRHKFRWLDFQKTDDHWQNMLTFLDKAYEQANQELALLSVYGSQDEGKKGVKSAGLSAVKVDTEDDDLARLVEAKKRAREACGNCPVCSKTHTWVRRDGSSWPSDRLIQCQNFSNMNIQQRATAVESAGGCPRCTSWGHQRKACKMRADSCGADVGASKCKGDHSKLLHGSGNVYCAALNAGLGGPSYEHVGTDSFSCVKEGEDTIFYLQDVPVKKAAESTRVMWDRGSNRVLIREEYAKDNRLISKEVTYSMETVGSQDIQMVNSHIYLLDMVDMYGNVHTIWGYGVPRIMSSAVPDLSSIRKLFPHIPAEAFEALASKEVDVLIGLNMNELQPAGGLGVDRVGGLSALRSLFGCGWVIGGHHDDIKGSDSNYHISTRATTLKIAKILLKPEPSHTPEFWEAEGMGVLPPPRCDSCRGCMAKGACSQRHYDFGVKKQAELDLIKSKTKLIDGEIWCEYPFLKDPACLAYNRHAAVKVAEKVEKDLIRDGLHSAYNEQVRQFLDRGVAVRLSAGEMESYTGPCQYITHHAVLKDSVTTTVRLVSNSSFNNGGNSLNSCLATGPNSLNPMLDVMLRF